MKFKKKIVTLLLLVVAKSGFATLLFFPENQAIYSTREYSQVRLPGSAFQVGVSNDAFDFKGFERVLKMCKKNYTLTQDDKDFLTANDLTFKTYNSLTALNFGSWNWNFRSEFIAFGDLMNLSSNFLTFIFEGNMDAAAMEELKNQNPGNGSETMVFMKSSFVYSKKEPFYIDNLFDFNYLNFVIVPGFNVNVYSPIKYARVETDYFTVTDSSANIQFTRYNSESDEFFSGFGLGLGMGMKVEIENGWLYLSVDDLLASMNYQKIKKERVVIDMNLPGNVNFEDDGNKQTYDENFYDYTVNLDPTVVMGVERYLTNDFSVMVKLKNCDYALDDGVSGGFNYMPNPHWPMQVTLGNGHDGKMFYKLKTGLIFSYFESDIAFFFADGIFTSAKGYGIEADLFKIKF